MGKANREVTQRGFRVFGRVEDSKKNVWRFQESSAAFEGAHCWIFWDNGRDEDTTQRPHLSVRQAKEAILLLQQFVREAEGGLLTEGVDGEP